MIAETIDKKNLGNFKKTKGCFSLSKNNEVIIFTVNEYEYKIGVFLFYHVNGIKQEILVGKNTTNTAFVVHHPYEVQTMRNLWKELISNGFTPRNIVY